MLWRGSGEAPQRLWPCSGEALERLRRGSGHALERLWPCSGEALERIWPCSGEGAVEAVAEDRHASESVSAGEQESEGLLDRSWIEAAIAETNGFTEMTEDELEATIFGDGGAGMRLLCLLRDHRRRTLLVQGDAS